MCAQKDKDIFEIYQNATYNPLSVDRAWFAIGKQGTPCRICEDKNGVLMTFMTPQLAQNMIDKYEGELGKMAIMLLSYPISFHRLKVDVDLYDG